MSILQPCFSQVPDSWDKIKFPPLDWKVPQGDKYKTTLDNKLIAYIAVDSVLPYFAIQGYIGYGTINDPPNKEGISSLLVKLLRSGGTKVYLSDSLDHLIDLYALNFSFSVSKTEISFSCSGLSDFLDTALFMLSQMLFYPSFEDKKFKKEVSNFLDIISHRFDNPSPILQAVYEKTMYKNGENSRLPTEKSVKNISKKDIIELHKDIFKTQNIILSIAGNFSKEKVVNKLITLFPSSSDTVSRYKYPSINISPLSKMVIINKKLTQCYVRMGFPLFKRPNDDYYPVQILNVILGGDGFNSRLNTKIRSDEGLAYVVYSNAESNYFYPATLFIEFHTKNETASKVIYLALKEIEKIQASGINDTELTHAKKVLIDGFPSMFRTKEDIVDNYAYNEFLKRPMDHFINYPNKINAIKKEEVDSVAKKYLNISSICYTIVGDTSIIFKNDTVSGFSLKNLKPFIVFNQPDSVLQLK